MQMVLRSWQNRITLFDGCRLPWPSIGPWIGLQAKLVSWWTLPGCRRGCPPRFRPTLGIILCQYARHIFICKAADFFMWICCLHSRKYPFVFRQSLSFSFWFENTLCPRRICCSSRVTTPVAANMLRLAFPAAECVARVQCTAPGVLWNMLVAANQVSGLLGVYSWVPFHPHSFLQPPKPLSSLSALRDGSWRDGCYWCGSTCPGARERSGNEGRVT